LHDIAPDGGAIYIAVDALDEERFEMAELLRERADFVADQALLQRAQPAGVDQRLGQVLGHLAIPAGQQIKCHLALAGGGALGGGLPGEPKISGNERQQRAGGEGHIVELCLDEAVAGVDLPVQHQASPALHALGVAIAVADMVGEGTVDHLVIGVAQDAAFGVFKERVGRVGHHPEPAVLRKPAGRRDAAA